jgi:hypothetical protein
MLNVMFDVCQEKCNTVGSCDSVKKFNAKAGRGETCYPWAYLPAGFVAGLPAGCVDGDLSASLRLVNLGLIPICSSLNMLYISENHH